MSARSFTRLLYAILTTFVVANSVGCSSDVDEDVVAASSASSAPAKDAGQALKEVVEKKDANDARLARELARVGAFLTTDERSAYIKAFQASPDNRSVNADYQKRSVELDDELAKLIATPESLAAVMAGIKEPVVYGRGTVMRTIFGPRDLFEGYARLAWTPRATSAVKFATRLLAHDPAFAAIGASDQEVVERVLAPAMPASFVELLLELGDARAAQKALRSFMNDAGNGCAALADAIDGLTAGSNPSTLDNINVAGHPVGEPLRAIQGVITLWKIGEAISRGDAEAVIKGLLADGPPAVAGLARATELFRRTFLGIESTPSAEKIIRWAGRVGQGAGIILGVIALMEHAEDWAKSESMRVRVISDLVAVGSSVLLFVGAAPAAAIVAGVALGLSFFADFLHDREVADLERREMDECLGALSISAHLVDVIVHSDQRTVDLLSKQLGLGPSQLRWLASADETSVSGDPTLRFNGLIAAKKVFALDGDGVHSLLRAVRGGEPDATRGHDLIEYFIRGLEYSGPPRFYEEMSREEGLDWLQGEGTAPYVPDDIRDTYTTAFKNARAYLATH